jgi:hypothetical protein
MTDHFTFDGACRDEDLDRLRRWSALTPADPDARLAFARKLLDCRKADEAILEIRAVIAMVPNHLEARKLLESARALQLSGRTST